MMLMGIPICIFANGNMPQKVATAFSSKYPDASVHKWTVQKGDYLVKFRYDNRLYRASFDVNGSWEQTERKINLTRNLPAPVRKGFMNSGYQACNIDGIKEIITPSGHFFEVWVDDGNYYDDNHHDNFMQDYLLRFSADGNMMGAEVLP